MTLTLLLLGAISFNGLGWWAAYRLGRKHGEDDARATMLGLIKMVSSKPPQIVPMSFRS